MSIHKRQKTHIINVKGPFCAFSYINHFYNNPTKCTLHSVHTHIPNLSSIFLCVMNHPRGELRILVQNFLGESFIFLFKTVSFSQGCYIRCVIEYIIYHSCRLTTLFIVIKNNIEFIFLNLKTLKIFKILICSMLLYVGYYFTIIYGVAEIYIHCFSSYACLLGVEIF